MSERKIEQYLASSVGVRMEAIRAEVSKKEGAGRNYRAEISVLRGKLAKLKNLYINDLISLDEYKADHRAFSEKLLELAEKDRVSRKPDLNTVEPMLWETWTDIYWDTSKEGKREFWRALLRQIRIYPDRHIEFDLNTPSFSGGC